MAARLLFGEDIFISYSRADAGAYAAGLANRLSSRGFTCFLDQWGSEPGKAIPRRVLRTLERSSMLVLVGSPRAAASAAVAREVEAFLVTKRPIVPITVDGALEQSPWFAHIAGASLSPESMTSLAEGTPSESVLSRIESSFLFTKRNTRVRRGFLAAAAGLLLLIGVAAWRQYAASVATRLAADAQAEAAKARDEAILRARIANEQTELATKSAAEAKRQEGEAKRQEEAAIKNARRALEQQQLAEERTRRARSLDLAAASRSMLDSAPDVGALLAIESFATADTFESRRALLSALSQQPLLEAVLTGQNSSQFSDVRFSNDGKQIAARDWDGAISVWPATKSPRTKSILASGDIKFSQVSPDFTFIVGRSKDETLHIQPLRGAKQPIALAPQGDPDSLAISPDSTLIATGTSDGIVELWNARDGTRSGEPLTKTNRSKSEDSDIALVYPVTALTFSPDGKLLHWRTSNGSRETVDVSTRQPAVWLPEEFPMASARAAFGVDGADVAYIANDGRLFWGRLYEGKLQSNHHLLPQRPEIAAVAISRDGMLIAAGSRDGTLYLFEGIESRAVTKAHIGTITALAFSPDGSRLVSVGDDRRALLWRTRDVALYQRVERPERETSAGVVRFTPKGNRLLVTSGKSVLVVDVDRAVVDGAPIQCGDPRLTGLSIHPNGRTVAVGGSRHSLFFLDLASRQCRERPRKPVIHANVGTVTALAFSPDGTQLASADMESGLAVWKVGAELQGKYLRKPDNNSLAINSIVWISDGKTLAIGSEVEDLLWRADGSKSRLALSSSESSSRMTATSRNGRLLAASNDEGVQIWDTASRREVARFTIEKPPNDISDDTVTALAFGHDGALLAVGQENGRLSLFDVAEGRWLGDLPLPPGCFGSGCQIDSVDFSSGGERLAALMDHSIFIWRLDPRVWVQRASELANRRLSEAEQRRYLRGPSK